MKNRNGFVSNSSSSSFVCQVSGEAFEVNDGVFRDCGLAKCRAGHVFKEDYLVNWEPDYPSREEMLAQLDTTIDSKRECNDLRNLSERDLRQAYSEKFLNGDENGYDVHVNRCPICTMTKITDSDLLKYMLLEAKTTREELVKRIQTNYERSIVRFHSYINQKNTKR